MSRWRTPLAVALAWLAVVAVGATAVWWVISSVGEDLGPGPSVTAGVPATPGGRGTTTSAPSPTSGPSPSATPSPRASGSPGSPASPREVVRQGTWSGRGGYVTARCRGARVGLAAAQPDPGYAVAVVARGPVRVEVVFEGRTEDGGRRVDVRADCVAGRPSFAVATGGGGDE